MNQEFTNNWFDITAKPSWDQILPRLKPQKILEIGSYEGASMCYAIRTLSPLIETLEIHCIDTWDDGIEDELISSGNMSMREVEERFISNINIEIKKATCAVQITCHKERSITALSKLIAEGKSGFFDFAYIDGSHQAALVFYWMMESNPRSVRSSCIEIGREQNPIAIAGVVPLANPQWGRTQL